jgi:predicted RNA-binding Zn ribbon-like protein
VQFNTYTVAGAHVAVWLVNHPAPEPRDLTAALRDHDVHEPAATAADALALGPWAARLREVFEAGTVTAKAELADALLVAADCRPRLVSHGAGEPFHFHYAPVGTGLAPRVRALTAAGLAHVIDEGGAPRLGACTRPGCDTVFLDTSRNGRRHFCTLRCANQVNVTNHRHRHPRPAPLSGVLKGAIAPERTPNDWVAYRGPGECSYPWLVYGGPRPGRAAQPGVRPHGGGRALNALAAALG